MRKNYGNKKFDAFETLQCSPCYALLISFVETDSNDLTATLTTKPFSLTFYVSDEYLFSEKIKY